MGLLIGCLLGAVLAAGLIAFLFASAALQFLRERDEARAVNAMLVRENKALNAANVDLAGRLTRRRKPILVGPVVKGRAS